MKLAQAKTIGETLFAGRPSHKDPAYTLWLQAVSEFVKFVEEDNPAIDPEALARLCLFGYCYRKQPGE
jgi:hypothetical protein